MLTNVWPHKENSGPDLSGSFGSERMHTICVFSIKTQFNASVPHSQHQVLNLSDYNNSNHFFYFVFFLVATELSKVKKHHSYMSDPGSCVNL